MFLNYILPPFFNKCFLKRIYNNKKFRPQTLLKYNINIKPKNIINYLRNFNIPASDFPTLHPKIWSNQIDYYSAIELYNKSVTLPVHQDMRKSEINYILDKISLYMEQ